MPTRKYKARELMFPGVEVSKSRHGKFRYYYRKDRASARVRLDDDPKSPKFMADYQACVAGQPIEAAPTIAQRTSPKSFGALIKRYLDSSTFKGDFAESTQATRRRQLEKIGQEHGHLAALDINEVSVKGAIQKRPMHEGNALLTTLKKMYEWATNQLITDPATGKTVPLARLNPAENVRHVQPPKRRRGEDEADKDGHPTMTPAQQAHYEAEYPHGTHARLRYEVLFCTGLRVGDAARLGNRHVKHDPKLGEYIQMKTEKTGTEVNLRITPRLKHALAAGPKSCDIGPTWLTLQNGKPIDKGYLTNLFSADCDAIGITCSPHSMRKAAANYYIENGADIAELKALFGWESTAMVDKYTKKFDRRKKALGAQDKLDFAPTPILGEGKTG